MIMDGNLIFVNGIADTVCINIFLTFRSRGHSKMFEFRTILVAGVEQSKKNSFICDEMSHGKCTTIMQLLTVRCLFVNCWARKKRNGDLASIFHGLKKTLRG